MNPSPISIALLLAIGASTSTVAMADTPPTAPGNLTARLYAGAGGEIFWNRSTDDRGVRGYEITRNGQSIGLKDALSFYDASLRADTAYTFTVTAVDTAGQRSASSTVKLGTTTSTPVTQPDTDAPASPAGLRASVYSAASAELFWTRATKAGLRYEVRRDGNVVTTTDGISHYATDLAAGRSYAYQVIAIDGSGKRSAPASIEVITRSGPASGTPATPVTPPSTGGDTLAAIQPKDVSIKIYSATAAELFWTPAGAFRPVIQKNEIRRDGVLIATVQGEYLRSYFDGSRVPGKRYSYEITAISSAGRASASISDTSVNPPQPVVPPTTTTPVNDLPSALRTKLANTFEIINGVPVEKVMATLGRFADRDVRTSLGLVRTGSRVNSNGSDADVFSCPKGGELLDSLGDSPKGRYSYEIEASDCAIGPIVFSGLAQIGAPVASGEFRPSSVNALNIELDDARDLSTITSENMFFFSYASDPRFSSWSGFGVSVDRPQSSYSAGTMYGDGRDQGNALPDGSFGLTANARNVVGATAGTSELRTLGPMEFANGRDNASPNAGRVSMGSTSDSLLIDAFNGDPATFTLTSTTSGTTTSYTVKFSDTYRFEAPIPTSVNSGF